MHNNILGLLARSIGNLDRAVAISRMPGPPAVKLVTPELAWTCCYSADDLIQRNGDGHQTKSMTTLGESLSIFSELGTRPLMERAIPC